AQKSRWPAAGCPTSWSAGAILGQSPRGGKRGRGGLILGWSPPAPEDVPRHVGPQRLEVFRVEPAPRSEPVGVTRWLCPVAEVADHVEVIGLGGVDEVAPRLRAGGHDAIVRARPRQRAVR